MEDGQTLFQTEDGGLRRGFEKQQFRVDVGDAATGRG